MQQARLWDATWLTANWLAARKSRCRRHTPGPPPPQAEERRDFLCGNPPVRRLWFAALEAAGGFGRGAVRACKPEHLTVMHRQTQCGDD